MTFLTSLITLVLLSTIARSQSRDQPSWQGLIEQDPDAQSILIYCNTIKISEGECSNKFFRGLDNGSIPPSTIALKAAAICLNRNKLGGIDAFKKMFNLDMLTMSQYAEGKNTYPPRLDYHYGPDGNIYRQGYKHSEREAGGKTAGRGGI
jgi:hypothetical protein